jgi:hypothetical protein
MRLFDEWTRVDKPIIVAMNGPGLLTLPILSDIVIAERHSPGYSGWLSVAANREPQLSPSGLR